MAGYLPWGRLQGDFLDEEFAINVLETNHDLGAWLCRGLWGRGLQGCGQAKRSVLLNVF
jgi:hypothetical protein